MLISLLNAAVITDFTEGKIRNPLILVGFFLGLLYQIVDAGFKGSFVFAGGVLLALVSTLPLYVFGAIGAGDGKLLAVAGGFLGMEAIPMCLPNPCKE